MPKSEAIGLPHEQLFTRVRNGAYSIPQLSSVSVVLPVYNHQRLWGKPGDCPVTETVGDHLLRLPCYNSPALEDQQQVAKLVRQFAF